MKVEPYLHKIQYYETDQMGIVHHSNFIRWFEEARVDFLDQIDLSFDRVEKEGLISPVIEVNCQYKVSAKFGDSVIVYVSLKSLKRVKFFFEYEIRSRETGSLLATGHTGHCFIDPNGKILSLEKENKEYYNRLISYLE